jgi:hypothetical protein
MCTCACVSCVLRNRTSLRTDVRSSTPHGCTTTPSSPRRLARSLRRHDAHSYPRPAVATPHKLQSLSTQPPFLVCVPHQVDLGFRPAPDGTDWVFTNLLPVSMTIILWVSLCGHACVCIPVRQYAPPRASSPLCVSLHHLLCHTDKHPQARRCCRPCRVCVRGLVLVCHWCVFDQQCLQIFVGILLVAHSKCLNPVYAPPYTAGHAFTSTRCS